MPFIRCTTGIHVQDPESNERVLNGCTGLPSSCRSAIPATAARVPYALLNDSRSIRLGSTESRAQPLSERCQPMAQPWHNERKKQQLMTTLESAKIVATS
jgi:hypothetical protein